MAEIRRLHDRRHRAQRGAFVVEGPQALEAGLAAGVIEHLYVTAEAISAHPDLIDSAAAQGVGVTEMTEAVAKAMSETENPQGLIGIAALQTRPWAIDDVANCRMGTVVLLERITDPGNAGTIIRTADAAGAAAVIVTSGSVDPHNGKCVRASAGSIFNIPVFTDADALSVIEAFRAQGVTCLAADGHGASSLIDNGVKARLTKPHLWVFGSEAHGVSAEVIGAVDDAVSIPIQGRAESLNLAAAVAICLYAPLL